MYNMPRDGDGRERESLLGVLRQHRFYYLWTFIALTLAWLAFAGWWQVEQGCFRAHWARCVDRMMPMASGAMPFIVPITVPISDVEIWLVRRFQLVFLNLPETREDRVRRDEQEKAEQRRREEIEMMRQEEERRRMEWQARVEAWRERMREAQEKGEPFDEPLPWE